MTTESFRTLVRAVVASSASDTWATAVGEWTVVELEEDPSGEGECVCGQTHLVKLFTIRNKHNGATLYPIGSKCVQLFGRSDLDRQISLLSGLLGLRSAIQERQDITLTSRYFTRAMLEDLYSEGAFVPDQWNGNDGWNDYDFLLQMFNKRDKDAISTKQQRKIAVLLNKKIFPFVLADERLR